MSYLYGDSSTSSLQNNYIDFLRDALDFSVQVLGADQRMRDGEARTVDVRNAGEAEVARLETLGAAIARSIEGAAIGASDSPTALCAQSVLRAAADLVRTSIDRVHVQVASDVAQIDAQAARERESCVQALSALLLRHDLPDMTRELRLTQQGGTRYAAQLVTRSLDDLDAKLELEIAATHPLGHVLRVDKLIERLEVQAPEEGGWLRKEVKLRPQRLDKEYITELTRGGPETIIKLRAAADGTGVGYDVVVRPDTSRVQLVRTGEASELPAFELSDEDTAKLLELERKLAATTEDLLAAKKTLLESRLGEGPLRDHKEPRKLVERLVAKMAPVVQEIGKRSLTPTELVLKRQLGDGRREEIFVSRDELKRKMGRLSDAARALFTPLGLGEIPRIVETPPSPPAPVEVVIEAAPAEVPPPAPRPSRPTPRPPIGDEHSEPPVRLDDSIERLIVSESVAGARKPE